MNGQIKEEMLSLVKTVENKHSLPQNTLLYEVLGLLRYGVDVDIIKDDLEKGNIFWNFTAYESNEKSTQEDVVVEEGVYKCKNARCGSMRCTISQAQTRSGDEGGTTYITCSECGTRYKFN